MLCTYKSFTFSGYLDSHNWWPISTWFDIVCGLDYIFTQIGVPASSLYGCSIIYYASVLPSSLHVKASPIFRDSSNDCSLVGQFISTICCKLISFHDHHVSFLLRFFLFSQSYRNNILIIYFCKYWT